MLLRITLSPELFRSIPPTEPAATLAYNGLIAILSDLTANGIIFVDSDGVLTEGIYAAIKQWPQAYATRAVQALELLRRRHRYVNVPIKIRADHKCNKQGCAQFCAIANNVKFCFAMTTNSCANCATQYTDAALTCVPESYALSDLAMKARRRTVTIGNGEWHQQKFTDEVLAPVLRDARIVKIYDRLIVRNIFDPNNQSTPGTQLKLAIPTNFVRTLNWLFETLKNLPNLARVEIYSTLQADRMDSPQLKAVHAYLENLSQETAKIYGIAPVFIVKQETERNGMPHGRYLVTDKVAILVERGFDLLWDDDEMKRNKLNPGKDPRPVRDVTLAICESAASIEKMTNLLRDIPKQ